MDVPDQLLFSLVEHIEDYAILVMDLNGRVVRWNTGAVVRVVDNGIGIPPDKLATIFELFTQAHSDYAESQSGLGIGLTLARELIVLHGGTIQARSEGIGRGSEFIFRLPLVPAAD